MTSSKRSFFDLFDLSWFGSMIVFPKSRDYFPLHEGHQSHYSNGLALSFNGKIASASDILKIELLNYKAVVLFLEKFSYKGAKEFTSLK